MALCGDEAAVFQQVFELFGVALHGAGGALVVEADCLLKLVADPKELGFLFALPRVRPEFGDSGEPGRDDGNEEERTQVGEAALAPTTAHRVCRRGQCLWRR